MSEQVAALLGWFQLCYQEYSRPAAEGDLGRLYAKTQFRNALRSSSAEVIDTAADIIDRSYRDNVLAPFLVDARFVAMQLRALVSAAIERERPSGRPCDPEKVAVVAYIRELKEKQPRLSWKEIAKAVNKRWSMKKYKVGTLQKYYQTVSKSAARVSAGRAE